MITSSDRDTAPALGAHFSALKAAGRKALVAYITAGHPTRPESAALLSGLAAAGADVIELGVPFSDPMADGPVIQESSQRALEAGMTLRGTLDLAARTRVPIPLVLFTYLNPLLAAGESVLTDAHAAGFRGVLVTDLPVGADAAREGWLGGGPLDFVRLVAPTTPVERMREIAQHGRGFVYLISRTGVTGVQDALPPELGDTIARLRSVCALPIVVGFGLSRPAQVAAVAELADGVVVGSALVRAAATGGVASAVALAGELRGALDSVR